MTQSAEQVAASLFERLEGTEILQDPFPHFIVNDALPAALFDAVTAAMPDASAFSPAEYPGTGRFTTRFHGKATEAQGSDHHGLVLASWERVPELRTLHAVFADPEFSRLMLRRFSAPGSRGDGCAIPAAKHALFTGGRSDYLCVFNFAKDPPGYEISPHLDNPKKLVTFLLYLGGTPPGSGTMLCRPRPGVDTSRFDGGDYNRAQAEGRSGLWLRWEDFDVVKEAGGPNVLFAFAPNDISYHAVRFSPSRPGAGERTVLRGFVARNDYQDTRLINAADR